jgi:hypothetical protein
METLEETRINLMGHCSFLGVMSMSQSSPNPKIKVLPFVAFVEDEPVIKLNKRIG